MDKRLILLGAMLGATIFGLLIAWGMVQVAIDWEQQRDEHVRPTR
jgi:hypothetical protein